MSVYNRSNISNFPQKKKLNLKPTRMSPPLWISYSNCSSFHWKQRPQNTTDHNKLATKDQDNPRVGENGPTSLIKVASGAVVTTAF